jgi:SAM-dependent methyltransferase
MEDDDRPPVGFDPTRPSPARVWDYFLGGKDNFAVDRQVAEMVFARAPDMRLTAQANRRFLERTVRFLAESGIRQFIDLGTGIPTSPNVHEVARTVYPSARVIYVDFDPLVVVHARALLATAAGVAAIQGDIRWPERILDDAELRTLIDFDEPVGVLFISVLPFVTDEEDPARVVGAFRERMATGSYLVISHASAHSDPTAMAQAEAAFANSSTRIIPRSHTEILRLFDGFELVEPGLVDIERWRSETGGPPTKLRAEGGVGRKV